MRVTLLLLLSLNLGVSLGQAAKTCRIGLKPGHIEFLGDEKIHDIDNRPTLSKHTGHIQAFKDAIEDEGFDVCLEGKSGILGCEGKKVHQYWKIVTVANLDFSRGVIFKRRLRFHGAVAIKVSNKLQRSRSFKNLESVQEVVDFTTSLIKQRLPICMLE
jgi:hypothetical protein